MKATESKTKKTYIPNVIKFFVLYPILFGLLYLLFWPVPINPVTWESPDAPALEGIYQPNDFLKSIKVYGGSSAQYDILGRIIIEPGGFSHYAGPEDIVPTDKIYEIIGGTTVEYLYAGYDNGHIIKYRKNTVFDGTCCYKNSEFFYDTKGRPLGMALDANNNLIVADALRGLLAINQEGIGTTLSTKSDSDGIPMKFTDDLDIAKDGKIYFSDASSVYGIGEDRFDLMEHRPHGRLLMYDPETKLTTTLLDSLYFANGVAIAPDNSFVLVNETYMYRIHKYWLKGEKAGTSEIIIDNLPGFPDNISSNGEGLYWVALFTSRNEFIEKTSNKPFLRKMALRLPKFLQPQPEPFAFVLGIDGNGKVIHNLQYHSENAFSPITSVKQVGDQLFFGSLTYDGFGSIAAPKLKTPYHK
tara:strand:- start:2475 stop:3716 length:1242 start_codon:yes stop_codon:yes gene_type:complete